MERRSSRAALCGVAVACATLGFLAGRWTRLPRAAAPPEISGPLAETHFAAPRFTSLKAQSAPEHPSRGSRAEAPPAESEQELAASIEKIAAHDHARALAMAATEANWRRRTLLRNAALRGWASVALADAAQFAVTLTESERPDAVAAVFLGAKNQPDAAAKVATSLCAQDPARADNYGRALIEALSEAGAFETLVRFSTADTSGHGADWLSATFYQWAERQPAEARRSVESLTDPEARRLAFQGLMLGWAVADPSELANYAVTLPPGENRSLALRQALGQWFYRDPESVASWVIRFDPGPDFDLSAAAVALSPKLAAQQPKVALGWAQSVVEPALRESTLTALARLWGEQPERARLLIAETAGLSSDDRRILLAGLAHGPPETE